MRLFKKGAEKIGFVEEQIMRGDAARDGRNWDEAISAYKDALERNPTLAGIWVQYAHALKEADQVDAAI